MWPDAILERKPVEISLPCISLQNKLCAPGSTAAVERIFSIAGYILSQRRTRITDDNFQNQLFANVNSDLPEVPGKKLRLEK